MCSSPSTPDASGAPSNSDCSSRSSRKVLESRLPDHMQAPNAQWFGFSARARVIVYNKAAVNAADVQNYEDLANPKLKGKVCTRSGSHVYNLSLMSALIEHWGEAKAEDWAKGVVANFARTPKGGDTDQIMAVAAGECGVAISNSYYFVRLMKSAEARGQEGDRSRSGSSGRTRRASART